MRGSEGKGRHPCGENRRIRLTHVNTQRGTAGVGTGGTHGGGGVQKHRVGFLCLGGQGHAAGHCCGVGRAHWGLRAQTRQHKGGTSFIDVGG